MQKPAKATIAVTLAIAIGGAFVVTAFLASDPAEAADRPCCSKDNINGCKRSC